MALDENIGKTIGIYKVLDVYGQRANDGHKLYNVECIFCGWLGCMKLSGVKYAKKCTHVDVHGDYKKFNAFTWSNKRIHTIFKGMIQRCYNPNDKDWDRYGGRGINICDEWVKDPKSFEVWAIEQGYSDNLTIDRINENDGYCPNNCRWVAMEQNARYKSTTSLIDVDGERHTGREWSKTLGLSINTVNTYVRKYGLNNTVEFIRKYKENPIQKAHRNQSYYDLYMDDNTTLT